MKLVKLDDDVWVNPEHVVSVDHKDADICVWLVNGQYYELPLDVDVYEVLDRLDLQQAKSEAGLIRADAESARDWWPR